MGFLNNLSSRLSSLLREGTTGRLSYDQIDKRKPLRLQIKQRTFRADLSMKDWRIAVELAENHLMPRREQLLRLYHRTMEDGHVLSQVRTARMNVQMAPFEVLRDGTLDETASDLFRKPWFYRLLRYFVDTEMYGHTIVEFSDRDWNGIYKGVHIIPREHVRPENGEIVMSISDSKGLPYRVPPVSTQALLFEIGDDDDLGLFKAVSKNVIRKEYTLSDWSRRNERFGMPFVTMKTASRDDKELDAKERMLENFGANGWAIVDDEDTIDLKESVANTGGAHRAYQDFKNDMDAENSLLINGQTGTSEEKAYVGSAEVHERVLNKYTLARLLKIQYDVNDRLIPFLTDRLQYPLQDCSFEFLDLREEEEEPKMQTDPVKEPATGEEEEKKS